MDAVFALWGGLAGTAVFAHFHEILIPILYGPTNVGQITLADWLNSKPLAVVILVAAFGICIWGIGVIWGRGKNVQVE
jgi:hypothetical protein